MTMDISSDDARIAAGFERFSEVLRRLTPREGLSLTAASTLRRLESSGPHRLSELFGPEGVTQPAMTQLVTRLQESGLAERVPDPDDGRVVLVHITDAGRAELAGRRAIRTERIGALFDRLTTAEREALFAALPAISALTGMVGEPRGATTAS